MTRDFSLTIIARLRRDPEFRASLLFEAGVYGEVDEGVRAGIVRLLSDAVEEDGRA